MDPITGAIIAGGSGLVGSIIQGEYSRRQANAQMDFQRDMSSSAHVREVADLRNAGLNPILSALGSGASTPGGAMGETPDFAGALSTGMNTALAIRTQNKDLEQKDSLIGNTDQDTQNKRESNKLINQQAAATALDVKQKAMSNKVLEQTIDAQIKKARAEGDYAEINQLMGVINSGASSANQLVNPLKLVPNNNRSTIPRSRP